MGASLLALEEGERGETDFEGMSDSETDEQRHVFVAMPRGLQRSVEAPGFTKRTYGVLSYESSLERRRRCAKLDEKLDEKLDGLRAVLPNLATRRERNESVVMDAHRYIATLQQQVEDLSAEVLECEEECERRGSLSHHSASDQQPLVEVMKSDGVMQVRIVCANRPGLLVDVMDAVESRGLIVTHARIACHSDIVLRYLSLENEESATISLSTEGGSSCADVEEELDSMKAMLMHAICQEGFASDLQ